MTSAAITAKTSAQQYRYLLTVYSTSNHDLLVTNLTTELISANLKYVQMWMEFFSRNYSALLQKHIEGDRMAGPPVCIGAETGGGQWDMSPNNLFEET